LYKVSFVSITGVHIGWKSRRVWEFSRTTVSMMLIFYVLCRIPFIMLPKGEAYSRRFVCLSGTLSGDNFKPAVGI